jgi:ribosomal protein S18 acetylase RimI-like enzyme
MTLSDWRDATAEAVQPLLLAERRRVLEALHWDLGPAFKAVELARQRGDVPGLLLTDQHGRHAGWAFYLLANRQLQIGGLQAASAGGLRVLLDGILSSTEATLAAGISCFLEASTRSLPSALTRLRFDLQRHEYLEATLSEPWTRPPVTGVRRFDRADIPEFVRLLAKTYSGQPVARVFAPNARLEEWAQYAAQLLGGPAVGAWQPDQSFVVPDTSGRLVAAIVTTEVARGIAHVAQVVVDPQHRRQGLGRALMAAAGDAARQQGARRMTLMTASDNAPALSLYASLGFAPRGQFLSGRRGPVPRTMGGVTFRAGQLKATA